MADKKPTENPFAAPVSDISVQPENARNKTREEIIREAHIGFEKNIMSMGLLFVLGGISAGIVAVASFMVLFMVRRASTADQIVENVLIFIVSLSASVLHLAIGIGLRRLSKWSRFTAAAVSIVWLLFVPIGTVIGLVCLYFVLSEKGAYIFTDEYRDIIIATPHIKMKTSKVLIAVAFSFFAILCFIFVFV